MNQTQKAACLCCYPEYLWCSSHAECEPQSPSCPRPLWAKLGPIDSHYNCAAADYCNYAPFTCFPSVFHCCFQNASRPFVRAVGGWPG